MTKAFAISLLAPILFLCTAIAPRPDCTCPDSKVSSGWCRACQVGYVASVEIRSALLFEALDAHGHQINPDSIECGSCRTALESDGFCDACKRGFVAKELYFSPLTYHLAKGKVRDTSRIACRTCRLNTC